VDPPYSNLVALLPAIQEKISIKNTQTYTMPVRIVNKRKASLSVGFAQERVFDSILPFAS